MPGSMKISIRKKVILSFAIFIGISAIIWFRSYYSQYILHQKLQIIERKNSLFNTILEARRYEKNFFLSLDKKNIDQALDYIHEAEDILSNLTSEYGKYTLAKNLPERLIELKAYKKSLLELLELNKSGTLLIPRETIIFIQQQGHKITTELEKIVKKEGKYTQDLVGKTKTIHYIALVPVFILSILIAIFLIFNVNRPLKTIENAIKKIAKGDFKNIPDISTGDEFESLVDSLNNMIDELNSRNEQLIQAKKLASLGRLTSGVAHELNNPLNNISTSLQILIEELEEENLEYKRDLLIGAEQEVVRGKNIVRALLEFSRERSFAMKWINFKALVHNAIKRIKAMLPDNVTIKVDVPDDIQVYGGPDPIERVLINLFDNAVQAMEDGGEITITAFPREATNDGLCLQVRDNGSGIPEEDLGRIFDPFYSTKEVGKGSGLGLSIVYGIIEQHGGEISVASEEGKGTTFSVYLPNRPP
jgi:two-component system NtrC family sensor kinase